jgi:hypothetical protein
VLYVTTVLRVPFGSTDIALARELRVAIDSAFALTVRTCIRAALPPAPAPGPRGATGTGATRRDGRVKRTTTTTTNEDQKAT